MDALNAVNAKIKNLEETFEQKIK